MGTNNFSSFVPNMYCKHCGKPIDADSMFCKYCGMEVGYKINVVDENNESLSSMLKSFIIAIDVYGAKYLQQIVSWIIRFFKGTKLSVIQVIKGFYQCITRTIKMVGMSIADFFKNVVSLIKGLFCKIGKGIKRHYGKILIIILSTGILIDVSHDDIYGPQTTYFDKCKRFFSWVTPNFKIPNRVTIIADGAFLYSSVESIFIPESVTSIGANAFRGCEKLTNITIPEKVEVINNSVFEGCTSLRSVYLHEGVTAIGICAFAECIELTSVYCMPEVPPLLAGRYQSIGLNENYNCSYNGAAFDNNAPERKIYLPIGSVDTYKSAPGWCIYASSIVGLESNIILEISENMH